MSSYFCCCCEYRLEIMKCICSENMQKGIMLNCYMNNIISYNKILYLLYIECYFFCAT